MNSTGLTTFSERATEAWGAFVETFLAEFLPNLILAILAFIIGWFIAVWIGKIVAALLKTIKFNDIFNRGVWKDALERAEFKVDASGFVGAVVKWVLVIVVLWIAFGFLGNSFLPITDFLGRVLAFLPNVIVAAVILVVAVIIADLLGKIVRAAVESMRVAYGHLVEVIVKWAVIIFAFWAALIELEVAEPMLMIAFQGLIYLVVIAGGIAFGLGGKDVAAEIWSNLHKKFKGER